MPFVFCFLILCMIRQQKYVYMIWHIYISWAYRVQVLTIANLSFISYFIPMKNRKKVLSTVIVTIWRLTKSHLYNNLLMPKTLWHNYHISFVTVQFYLMIFYLIKWWIKLCNTKESGFQWINNLNISQYNIRCAELHCFFFCFLTNDPNP